MYKKLLAHIFLFLLVFDLSIPPIKSIGSAPFVFIISIFFIIINRTIYKRFFLILKKYNYLIALYFLLLLYAIFRIVLTPEWDVKFILSMFKALIILFSTFLYLSIFEEINQQKVLFNIFLINAIICLVVGTYTELQPLINIFKYDAKEVTVGIPYRNSFLSGSGYFGVGALYGLIVPFFLAYLMLNKNNNSKVLNYILLLVIFIAGVFAARTSLYSLLIMIIFLILVKRKYKLIIGILLLIPIFSYLLTTPIFLPAKMWLMESLSVITKGRQSSVSVEALTSEHLKIPSEFITFFFGDGIYSNSDGSYYMNTDIGYLRHWFFGGIFFLLEVLLIPFFLYKVNKSKLFLFTIIPIILLLNFKGVFLLNNPGSMPILILITEILQKEKIE